MTSCRAIIFVASRIGLFVGRRILFTPHVFLASESQKILAHLFGPELFPVITTLFLFDTYFFASDENKP